MQIREALITQSPSLALQRQAADEIARLDAQVLMLKQKLDTAERQLSQKQETVNTSCPG